jgi:hypothetical protein
LIKSGASADISDINGITPRQAAEKTGNKLLMGLFTQSVNSDKGNTPR